MILTPSVLFVTPNHVADFRNNGHYNALFYYRTLMDVIT
jgi:hypothetical protein